MATKLQLNHAATNPLMKQMLDQQKSMKNRVAPDTITIDGVEYSNSQFNKSWSNIKQAARDFASKPRTQSAGDFMHCFLSNAGKRPCAEDGLLGEGVAHKHSTDSMGGMGGTVGSSGIISTGGADGMASHMDGGGGGDGASVLALPSSFTKYMQTFKEEMAAAVASSVSQDIQQAAVTQMMEESNDEVMDKAVQVYLENLSEDDREELEQKCIDELKNDDDIRELAVQQLIEECEEELKEEAKESMIQDGTDIAAYLVEHGDDDDILEAAREIKRRRKAAR
mmetsp:Transcript_46335/g.86479  ORF Transcript_46335/g.86479 Transcript_46335/m.86479 type:complete len:281 (+) Transcript_46335:119-961(+)